MHSGWYSSGLGGATGNGMTFRISRARCTFALLDTGEWIATPLHYTLAVWEQTVAPDLPQMERNGIEETIPKECRMHPRSDAVSEIWGAWLPPQVDET